MAAIHYDIDPAHTRAHFSVRHMMISNVRGEFTKVTGTVIYDPDNPSASKAEATIDAASLYTGDEQRDAHLKSPDFLDVAKFPEIKFVGKSIERNGNDEYVMKGDMTIHGVTHEVVYQVEGPTPEVKDPWGNVKAGATATAKINRKDFGLVWNVALETGGILVGEEVKISLDVELTRRAA